MIARWTYKELLRSRTRVLASSLAVAAAFALVLVFDAVWTGEADHAVAYIENAGADVWVMQRDVTNMHMASSFVRDSKRDRVAEVEGVDRVSAILYLNTIVEAGRKRWFCYVVGVEDRGQLGGPWSLGSGREVAERGEAVVPEVMAKLAGIRLGGQVNVAGRGFEVVGLSSGTFSIGNPIAFVSADDIADILTLSGYDSYILATTRPGADAGDVAARIRREVDDVEVLTTPAFVANDRVLIEQMGVELIAIMTLIGTLLAVCLVAFVLYIHTSRSARELAILKAIGFRSSHIFAGVTMQAAVITGLAFLLAAALALLLAQFGPSLVPQLSMRVTGASLVKVAVSGLAVAAVAALLSARRVTAVDPMSVFRS